MVENLLLRCNKHDYCTYRALEDSATKIVPIVPIGPIYRSSRANFGALIIVPSFPEIIVRIVPF